jgi:hypothetical protein
MKRFEENTEGGKEKEKEKHARGGANLGVLCFKTSTIFLVVHTTYI